MKIFGRKAAADAGRARAARQKEGQLSSSHRVTLDLYRAEVLAAMMAKSRSSDSIETTDLLAGMYISNWDRLSRYWANSKQEEVETLLKESAASALRGGTPGSSRIKPVATIAPNGFGKSCEDRKMARLATILRGLPRICCPS